MEPSLSSPTVAPLLQDSWHSPHNPTFPSLASPNSDVVRVENACYPGSVAKFRGDHHSVQSRPCDKYGNRNGCGPSHKKLTNITAPPTLSSLCKSFWTSIFDGNHPCHSHHHRLCRWCHPIEEQHGMASALPAPTGSTHHLIL